MMELENGVAGLSPRREIFEEINKERRKQDIMWGQEFDDKNTPNDWVAYITHYAGKAVTMPWDRDIFRGNMLKIAAMAVAVLERDLYAPRHYDE